MTLPPVPEAEWWAVGLRVAGVDEAGRGAWAGPVAAGAVILEPGVYPFQDSKTLRAAKREELEARVHAVALACGVGFAEAGEVERLGVLKATHLAAERALACLKLEPQALLTDYLKLETDLPLLSPPKADRDSPTVAAASILAKVARDRHMRALEETFPGYGFARHKGYGTADHLQALARLGPCPAHRKTFAPVARIALDLAGE